MKLDKKHLKALFRSNKYTMIAIGIFIAGLLILFLIYKVAFPNSGAPVYGDRLEGIEEVKISNEELEALAEELDKKEMVTEADAYISGRIIKTIVIVKKDTKAEDAKTLSKLVYNYFDKEYQDFYDYEIFIKNEDDKAKGYPIIGYKSNDNTSFSYSSSK